MSQFHKYMTGDVVAIRKAYPIGHCRTPFYARGLQGTIERHCGNFANPEGLAYGRDGQPAVPLYRVRVLMADLWPDYHGSVADTLEVEVFEHWLTDATSQGRNPS